VDVAMSSISVRDNFTPLETEVFLESFLLIAAPTSPPISSNASVSWRLREDDKVAFWFFCRKNGLLKSVSRLCF
jgi:hypothetical protein